MITSSSVSLCIESVEIQKSSNNDKLLYHIFGVGIDGAQPNCWRWIQLFDCFQCWNGVP